MSQPKPGPFDLKSTGHGLLVNVAAHPPEGGPAEASGLSASNLPRHDRLKLGER